MALGKTRRSRADDHRTAGESRSESVSIALNGRDHLIAYAEPDLEEPFNLSQNITQIIQDSALTHLACL